MTNSYLPQSITQWAEEDRPREKMQLKGLSALSDADLLAILINSGIPGLSAVALAQQVLSSVDNNLHELGKRSVKDLKQFKGIGEAKAITIAAALELDELDEAVLPSPQKDSVSVSGHSVVRAAQTPSTQAEARNWFSPFEQLQHVGAQSS